MIIANTTSSTAQFEFGYEVSGPAYTESASKWVQVDAGPHAQQRAREVFLRQLDCYHERDRRWIYKPLPFTVILTVECPSCHGYKFEVNFAGGEEICRTCNGIGRV